MEDLIENIEQQLIEIEILKSIYSNPNEFVIEDEFALFEAKEFLVERKIHKIPQHTIGFVIKFNANSDDDNNNLQNSEYDGIVSQIPVEIVCRLPHDYPIQSKPEVLVRCSKENLNRKFYENLNKHIAEIHNAECSILTIIDWIRDNLFKYLSSNKSTNIENKFGKLKIENNLLSFTRVWIYFHHIYSTEKETKLNQWAKEFELTGFVMPGKPGVLCIEGIDSNIQEYLTRVKKLPWQKVQVKDTETFKCTNLEEFRKFNTFEENFFTNESSQTHDLGLLFSFLKEKNLSHVFSLYFGVEGKISNKND